MTYELNGVSRLDPQSMNGIEELENYEPWEVAQALREMGYAPENYSANPQNGIFSAIAGVVKGVVGGVKKLVGRIKQNKINRNILAEQQMQQGATGMQPAYGMPMARPQFAAPMPMFAGGGGMAPQQMSMFGTPAVSFGGGMTEQQKKTLMYVGLGLAGVGGVYLLTRKRKGRR